MKHNEYLKIKNKYEAVLFELMKEVSNQLEYDDCNILYKEMALSLITASFDLDRPKEDVMEDLCKFGMFMVANVSNIIDQVKDGEYVGRVIR